MYLKSALIVAFSLAFATVANADPRPLGFELGKATVSQVQSKYSLRHNGTNAYSNGPMYYISPNEIGLNGLQECLFIFTPNNVLDGAVMTFNAGKSIGGESFFDNLVRQFKAKYRTISVQRPFVGNAYAKFRDGNSIIEIDSPHMSFSLEVRYLTDSFENSFKSQQRSKQQQTEQNQMNLL